MYRIGIGPVEIELFNSGQRFRRLAFVENRLEPAFANRIQHFTMQIAQQLFFVLIRILTGIVLVGAVIRGTLIRGSTPALELAPAVLGAAAVQETALFPMQRPRTKTCV